MADFYCDHGSYSSQLGTIPTWGVPQEGDGGASSTSNSASIASIAFSTVPTSGNFTICGVTFTNPSGVVNAASVDAAANALAGLINASTTTVGSSVAVGTPQLRNLVFARGPSDGAPVGTCQIMMRVGSTTLNHESNSNVALAHTFTGTPTVTQFAGGVSGCWGWWLNTTAIGVSSSIAVVTYGVFQQKFTVCYRALPGSEDAINIRTGNGRLVNYTTSSSINVGPSSNLGRDIRYIFDDNSVWTSDPGDGVFEMRLQITSQFTTINANFGANNQRALYLARRRGGFKIGINSNWGSATNNGCNLFTAGFEPGGYLTMVNVEMEDYSTRSDFNGINWNQGSGTFNRGIYTFRSCIRKKLAPLSIIQHVVGIFQADMPANYTWDGCDFEFNIVGVADPGPLVSITVNSNNWGFIRFNGCRFTGWPGGGNRFTLVNNTAVQSRLQISAENCTGLRLSNSYSGLSRPPYNQDPSRNTYFFQSADTGSNFRIENGAGVIEWDGGADPAFPTLTATMPDGTPYSLRAVWLAGNITDIGYAMRVPPLDVWHRMLPGVRTVSVNLMMRTEARDALMPGVIHAMLEYISAADGTARTVLLVSPPIASGKTWVGASNYPTFTAYEMVLTTPVAVKQNTRMRVHLIFEGRPPLSVTEQIYIDPEPSIT